jgi:hypothetical protein
VRKRAVSATSLSPASMSVEFEQRPAEFEQQFII